MKIRGAIDWLVVLTGAAPAAHAAERKPVTGTYAIITANNFLGPEEQEPRDTHFRLQLTGAAASHLYQAMKSAVVHDECTGASLKQVGDTRCRHYASDKRYECDFSIDIAGRKIDYGVPC